MIRLVNVCKSYRNRYIGLKRVLRDITLNLPDHKSIGILGRNGAGKSTFMRILSGAELPDKGIIDTGGKRISWPLGAGGGVHGSLTGRENIRFICKLYDYPFQQAYDFVEEFAELGKYMYVPVKDYSAGMKGRLAFGMSMILDFDTYLIDEGFSAGDAKFRKKSQEMFDTKRQKSNLIVVSHNPATIKRLCDWGAVMHNGKLTVMEDLDEAIKIYSGL